MKKFTYRVVGSSRSREISGNHSHTLDDIWLFVKCWFLPGTKVEISDGISSKVFVKEHLSGIAGAMPGRK